MTQENKQLLLKDLCARLPYECMVECSVSEEAKMDAVLIPEDIAELKEDKITIKPYLRPMSNMTEEECREYYGLCHSEEDSYGHVYYYDTMESIDWLNAHHFDYRGLIEKGLALEAPEGMYKIN